MIGTAILPRSLRIASLKSISPKILQNSTKAKESDSAILVLTWVKSAKMIICSFRITDKHNKRP